MEQNFNNIKALARHQCDFKEKYELKIVRKEANVEGITPTIQKLYA